MDAIAVQAFGDRRNADKVTDHGWYCQMCALEGLRRWLLDSHKTTSLRFFHGNVEISDDPVACAGCGLPLADGLNFGISDEPVGILEIAERLHVGRETVDKWRVRELLPAPDWTVGGRPAWKWATIALWAAATGRWRGEG